MALKFTLKSVVLFSFSFICHSLFTQNSSILKNSQFHINNQLPWFAEFKEPQFTVSQFWTWFRNNYPTYQSYQFKIESDRTDELEFRHIRYIQVLNNYPINHTAIILHFKNGLVESFNTDLFNFTPIEYKSHLTAAKTLETAIKYYQTTHTSSETTTPEIIWAKNKNNYSQDQFFLCHAYRIKISEASQHEKIYINESTGEIVLTENLIIHADTLNKAKTLYRGVRNFTADFVSKDSFRLRENGKRKISTFKQSVGIDFWNKTNNWKDSSLATNDIHWGTEVTMDMLKKRFNVNSFDNKGTLLYSLSQPSSSGNAYWTLGGNYVNYFTGSSGSVTPCASLDVVGHELGHGVLDGISGLIYSGESGSLHESFGDIQGYVVERTGDSTKYDWIVGDQVWVGGIRNMAKPKAFSNPNTYNGQYWGSGFHSNAGVQNHFFYTLTHGDTGTNDNSYSYSIKGLGFEKGVSIVYRAILNYITPNTDFQMVATFDVKSAKDLYGSCGIEAAMTKESWKAAGVIDTSVIINFSHGITNQHLYCGTNNTSVPFFSLGDASRKCTWYFSKTDSLKSLNSTKSYTSSGTYTIYLKTEVCNKVFSDTSSVSLSLNPIANLKSMSAKYCQLSDSLTITNLSVHTEPSQMIYYSWIVGPFNNYTLNNKDIHIARDLAADYYVELKAYYSNGCKDTASLNYAVVGNIKPSFTAKSVCPCQDLKLKNTTNISASTYSFKWVFDDTTSKTTFQPSKNYCRSGKHSITLFSNDLNTGCSDSAIKYVTIFDNPKAKIDIESFCYGDSVKLHDNSTHNRNIAYNEWTLGFWNPQNMNPVIFKVTDTMEKTYMLTVYDDLGCFNSTSITAKPELLNVDFSTKNYCENKTTEFHAIINNRMPVTDYFWVINNIKKYNNDLNPSEQFTPQSVTASFHATTKSCSASKIMTFEVFEAPKAQFTSQSELCAGDTFSFINNSVYSLPVTHTWNFSGLDQLKDKNVTKVWHDLITTSYTVCLKEQNNFSCSDSSCEVVTVLPNPTCDFTIENVWIDYEGRGYQFKVNGSAQTTYNWDFGDGAKGTSNNFNHQYKLDGKYIVKVLVKNASGCQCESSKELQVIKSNISNTQLSKLKIYPNPNDGIFKIEGLMNQNYTYQIYSIDGKMIINSSFTSQISEDLRSIQKGIYLLKVSDNNSTSIVKIELK